MAAKKIDLGEFEGQVIAGTTIALRNAGDGLSKAMKVDPQLLHHGQTVYVVYESRVIDVQHPEIPDSNEVNRKHILKAGTATIIDGALVREAINAQADRIQAARDAETGAAALGLEYDDGQGDKGKAKDGAGESGGKPPKPDKPVRKTAKKKAGATGRRPRKAAPVKSTHLSSVPSPSDAS